MSDRSHLVLITGPSGAGRVTAIRSLEDFGYEVIDNLPLALLRLLLSRSDAADRPLAVGIDVRTRDFSVRALEEFYLWVKGHPDVEAKMLFLECDAETLRQRFNETRRPHPVAGEEDVEGGIRREIDMLAPLRERADHVINTAALSPHDLKATLRPLFATAQEGQLFVAVQSFSYKKGLPAELDMAFDCRFLRNPHWDTMLRSLDGRDPCVADFVARDARHDGFVDRIVDMLSYLLPAYKSEGKAYFTVGFGCTGGQHRSVYMAEHIASRLRGDGWSVSLRHRALDAQRKTASKTGDT